MTPAMLGSVKRTLCSLGEPELVNVVGTVGLGARRALAVSALGESITKDQGKKSVRRWWNNRGEPRWSGSGAQR